ncbi:MAG: SIS domain-containing protein [Erysipelotrichaceae bacterium]|nr:SIS domain-containing protein [Erysipelotrichaceae bacterium]
MVTMLDCIRRTAPKSLLVFDTARTNTDELVNKLGSKIRELTEIIVVGSGSSHNASVTACAFMEKVSGLPVHVYIPNEFNNKTVFPETALYVFLSQSGTSTLLEDMLKEAKGKGLFTVGVTDYDDSPISRQADAKVSLMVGGEEYGYRTVGFCCSFLVLQMIALRIGLERGYITDQDFEDCLADGRKASENHPAIVEKTLAWFDQHKESLKEANSLLYYGSGSLYGIAIEGALKLLETAKLYLSIGFEAEDGLHGPNLGFNKGDVVIALCDGKTDVGYATSVVNFSKNELGQGSIFGHPAIDWDDLVFECASENFKALEMAPAVEVVAYMMAIINDVPVEDSAHRTPHPSSKYFQTHSK